MAKRTGDASITRLPLHLVQRLALRSSNQESLVPCECTFFKRHLKLLLEHELYRSQHRKQNPVEAITPSLYVLYAARMLQAAHIGYTHEVVSPQPVVPEHTRDEYCTAQVSFTQPPRRLPADFPWGTCLFSNNLVRFSCQTASRDSLGAVGPG